MPYLLVPGTDIDIIDKKGNTALLKAIGNREVTLEAIKLLLTHGADVNQADEQGEPPLHLAVKQGLTETVKKLLEYGADINQANESGYTPLHWACMDGSLPLTNLLIEQGASLDQLDAKGRSPLNYAKPGMLKGIIDSLLTRFTAIMLDCGLV